MSNKKNGMRLFKPLNEWIRGINNEGIDEPKVCFIEELLLNNIKKKKKKKKTQLVTSRI